MLLGEKDCKRWGSTCFTSLPVKLTGGRVGCYGNIFILNSKSDRELRNQNLKTFPATRVLIVHTLIVQCWASLLAWIKETIHDLTSKGFFGKNSRWWISVNNAQIYVKMSAKWSVKCVESFAHAIGRKSFETVKLEWFYKSTCDVNWRSSGMIREHFYFEF